MNTITLISKDRQTFHISEYQAEKFKFLRERSERDEIENGRIPMILPTVCTSTDILSKWSKMCNKESAKDPNAPIAVTIHAETLKLLLSHSDIYMNMDEEKIDVDLVNYAKQVRLLSRMQRFELIQAARYLQYDNINSLIKAT
jgi:hypothetical protein